MPGMKTRIYDRFDIFIVILGKVAHIFEGFQLSGGFLRNEASRCGFCGGSCLLFDGFLRNEATRFLSLPRLAACGQLRFGGGQMDSSKLRSAEAHRAIDESQHSVFHPVVEVFGCPGAGFQFAEAAHAPEMLGEFIDQDLFGGIGGLVLVSQGGAKVDRIPLDLHPE